MGSLFGYSQVVLADLIEGDGQEMLGTEAWQLKGSSAVLVMGTARRASRGSWPLATLSSEPLACMELLP